MARVDRWVAWAGAGGPGGWWARRRLDRAVRRGEQAVLDAAWARWLTWPDAALGELLLRRWQRPAAGDRRGASLVALGTGDLSDPAVVAAAVAAAIRADHPVGDTARQRLLAGDQRLVDAACADAVAYPGSLLAAFCREHRLVPSDPAARAVYYLVTGQAEQYRATDPDGDLLAAGYATARPGVQARLRAAMVEAGDLDLVRVVAGPRRERVGQAGAAEVGYLAGQLAARQAWDELWRLVTEVAPASAVELIALFPAGWRPAGAGARQLHAALAAAPPGVVAAAAPAAVLAGRLEVDGSVRHVAFSADGTRLAVVEHGGTWLAAGREPDLPAWVSLYAVPGLERRWRRKLGAPFAGLSRVLPVGERVLAVGGGTDRVRDLRLDRVSAGGRTTVFTGLYYPTDPLPLPAGFAVGDLSRLLLGTAAGQVARASRWWEFVPAGLDTTWSSLATEPGTGRMAVCGRHLVVLDRAGRPVAHVVAHRREALLPPHATVRFTGPDQLVVGTERPPALTAWRIEPAGEPSAELALAAEPVTEGASGPGAGSPAGSAAVAGLVRTGELDVDRQPELTAFPAVGLVRVNRAWHAAGTLAPVAEAGLEPAAGFVVAAPAGNWVAVPRDGSVTVYRLEPPAWVAELAHQPLAAARPADLERVLAEQRRATRPEVHALLALLRAGLEHRFGAEIEITPAAGLSIRDDDIALSAGDGAP